MTKVCRDCGIEKPLTEYYAQKGGLYGKRTFCKPCGNIILYKYRKANPGKCTAKSRLRQLRIEQCTPKWVDIKAIQNIYVNKPAGHEVDHIIPIKAKIKYPWGYARASGLHVPWNLQYLPKSQNRSKNNRV